MIQELLQYNAEMNEKIIRAFEDQRVEDEKCLSWLTHIIVAQHLWNGRLQGEGLRMRPWDPLPQKELIHYNQTAFEESLDLLKTRDPNEMFTYQNTRGETFHRLYSDIFLQLVTHGSYHRGQIAARMREIGYQPVPTDYIYWRR